MKLKILIYLVVISLLFILPSCTPILTGVEKYNTEYVYNFDDNDLSGWSGPANASIINQELVVSSTQGYIWRNIQPHGDSSFVKGVLELDVLLKSGGYFSVETKGGMISTNQLDWGIFTQLSNDSLFVVKLVNNKPKLFFTGYFYNDQEWYHLKFKFDSRIGNQGRYKLWIQPFGGEEKYLGEYDYRNGRLKGVHILAISMGDTNFSQTKEFVIDNIHFKLK